MKVEKYSKVGDLISEIELPELISKTEISEGAIYEAIKIENANKRLGNHLVKNRENVSGGGKKPWAQKGTGRARQGSIRAPHWVGGGTVHGPRVRDYSIKTSPKIKRKAVVSILAKKANNGSIKLIEDLQFDAYSTKTFYNILKKMKIQSKGIVSILTHGSDLKLRKSVENIPNVKYINADRIPCRDIFYNRFLLITEGALNKVMSHYYGDK